QSVFFDHMRQVHMDFHMPEFPLRAIESFNAKEFVDSLERGNINMVALFTKCHFGNSFYDTRAGHKHSGLEEDFLMEAASECRRRGIFTYAYYSLCTDVRAYREHENWRWVGRDGQWSGVNGPWATLCLNTPYKEELVLPQLTEVIKDYPVDALWLDIPIPKYSDGCFCPSCREKYRTRYGRELDEHIDVDEAVSWNFDAAVTLNRELRHIIELHGKDTLLCSNRSGHLATPLSFVEANDILCWESQPRNNYLSHSFSSRYVRTLDRPTQVMSVRFYQGWGDLTLKPTAQMTTEFAAMIGNGVSACSGDQVNVDGTLQPAVYDMFHESLGFVKAREDIVRGAQSVTEAAILAPVRSHDRVAKSAESAGVRGAHKMLVESHIQHDILSSQHLDALSRYRVIILPEPADYAQEVYPALEEWVAEGGTLIACGTSVLSSRGLELGEVFGVEYVEPSVFSVSHFKPHTQVQGECNDLVLQCRAATQLVIPSGAATLADYYFPQGESTPARAFRNFECAPPADEPSPYPFATTNDWGKGRAVYVAGSLFEAYWRYNHHWLRQFFEAVYRNAYGSSLLDLDVPQSIEANLMRSVDGDLLLNLIHYQVGHQGDVSAIPSIEKVYPFHGARCAVRGSRPSSVVLEPEGTELSFTYDNGLVRFEVPEIRYMAIVRIREAVTS
ncbi:MAG: beta-galactosidase trimerization domain-containing protein, partial [Spirochaetia bacterium]